MTDADEAIQDLSAETGLAPAVVVGVCSELAKNPTYEQRLKLCQTWGVGYSDLARLEEIRPRNLSAIGKGIAQQALMICNLAQEGLVKQMSNPAIVSLMAPKDLSSISKQQNDIAISQTKEAPMMGGGNTFNIVGGSIQQIIDLKAMRGEPQALDRLLALGLPPEMAKTATEV